MYLLDTNIWLERLLGQVNAEDVGALLIRFHLIDFTFQTSLFTPFA
jgi:predicted nucleic acid-binding protein